MLVADGRSERQFVRTLGWFSRVSLRREIAGSAWNKFPFTLRMLWRIASRVPVAPYAAAHMLPYACILAQSALRNTLAA